MEPKQQHPLHQIAETPTHKLLLKQWLKEEELIFNRISLKETQIDSVCKEITQLYIFFFLFHSISLLLLFNASSKDPFGAKGSESCKRSWIPSLCSLLCSLGIIWAVRYKNDVECHLEKLLEREKEDGQLLAKCVEELKKKGGEFDLLREVDALRRAKSLRVETKSPSVFFCSSLFLRLNAASVYLAGSIDTPDKSITVTRTDSCRGLDENQLFSSWVEKGIDIHRMKSFQILQSTTTSALLGQWQQKQSPVS
ncbi:hypothetical protein D5086_010410 [Populus alba]|uniref:Uncharacterized protein n=1 Tax=Populus alba TaxID=43335 RepID=A0ACC4C9Z4_POPAL